MGMVLVSAGATTSAALTFTPATGYTVSEVWSGADGAHFATEGGAFYVYGADDVGGGQFENVVRMFDGTTTVEIARSSPYAENTLFPDAITVVNGSVYWTQAQGYPDYHASLYKTWFDGGEWNTTTIFDDSAEIGVFSLSTDAESVFGVGLGTGNSNVAFYLDGADNYNVLADIPADGSGGSGFDPAGNFYAGAWSVGGDWDSHMYEFSAQQVADRLEGTQSTPYAAGDAVNDYLAPGNASTVMESDGADLFGTVSKPDWSGTDPYAFDLNSGVTTSLGTLSGADTSVSTDMYYRDANVFFMGKDDWTCGGEAVIYQLVPEPTSLCLLAGGILLLMRHREDRRRGR